MDSISRSLMLLDLEGIKMCNSLVRSARMEHVEGDRLSSLPDDLIHKILSFISIKDAIGTSVLSSGWRYIWTTMPYLNFENLNKHEPSISKFISNVLSHRNNQTQISSVNLVLERRVVDNESVKIIVNCASTHNVQQLALTRSPGRLPGRPLEYELSFFVAPKCNLPALTTLHLQHIKINGKRINIFSKCPNLKNLFLSRCTLMEGTKILNISHPRLCNLTLKYIFVDMEPEEYVNVVAPQLKNLSIKWCAGKHLISAPGLTSLVMEGSNPWKISTPEGFPSLEKVDIFMYSPDDADAHRVLSLLQQLRSVKLLILGLGILQYFSSSMELTPHQSWAFANAKIVNYTTKRPVKVFLEVGAQEKLSMSTEIINSETSPSAFFPMVSHEELTAMENMESAQLFVKYIRKFLKLSKANTNSDTNKAQKDEHVKFQFKKNWAWELRLNIGDMISLIKQSKFGALETCRILAQFLSCCSDRLKTIAWLEETRSLFQCIEELMTQLPVSKRAVMQPNFSGLCEDAATLTNNILVWMKTVKETR